MAKYIHHQDIASNTWTVNHDFGQKPIFDVLITYNGNLEKAFPTNIKHVDENTMIITFTSTKTGRVTCTSSINSNSFDHSP